MKKKTAILFITFLFASTAWAKDPEFVNSSRWKQEWSKAFMTSMNSGRAKDLLAKTSNLNDLKEFCPTTPKTEGERKLFWLSLFKNLTSPESSYQETDVSDGPNGPVVGLLQMGPYDAVRYGCSKRVGKDEYLKVWNKWNEERNKKVQNEELLKIYLAERKKLDELIVPELQNASNNIDCAIRIANSCAKRNAPWIAGGTRGSMGAIGCFWQPMRKGTSTWKGKTINNQKKRDMIKRTVARTCKATFGSGDLGKKPHGFTAKEIHWAGLGTSTPVKKESVEAIAAINRSNKPMQSFTCDKISLFDRLIDPTTRCRPNASPVLQAKTRSEIAIDGLTSQFLSDTPSAR